jgi:hypothetical protein
MTLKISLSLLTAAVFTTLASSAQTSDRPLSIKDGNTLKAFCKDLPATPTVNDAFRYGMCAGFILGVMDDEALTQDAISEAGVPDRRAIKFCVDRTTTTNGQLVAIVNKFLEEHSEHLDQTAAGFVSDAFSHAFPCKDVTAAKL